MIQDFKSNDIMPCQCGYRPEFYTVAYGTTPYSIHCKNCKKSLHGGYGSVDSFITVWNYIYAMIPARYRMFDISEIRIAEKKRQEREDLE
jgi:hypothetical protein